MNNQTIETLNKIAAKRTLGMSLTEHENAMWTLYGDAYTNGVTLAAPEKAQTVAAAHTMRRELIRGEIHRKEWSIECLQKDIKALKQILSEVYNEQ